MNISTNTNVSFSQQLSAAKGQTGISDADLSGRAAQIQQNFNINMNGISQANEAKLASGNAAVTPGTIATSNDMYTAIMSQWGGKMDQTAQMGAALDKMESQAEELMKSPKKEDQLKGQQMMQAMSQIMEAMIKAIQQTGQAAKDAIQAAGH
jgi:hypothetical protein